MTASDARPPSDTGTRGYVIDPTTGYVYHPVEAVGAEFRPVLVVDPVEARETIARALYVAREWGGCAGAAWERVPQHVRDRYLADADAVFAALGGQEGGQR